MSLSPDTNVTTRPSVVIDGYPYPLFDEQPPKGFSHPRILPDEAGEIPEGYGTCLSCGDLPIRDEDPFIHTDDAPFSCTYVGYWPANFDGFHGLCAQCGPCDHAECNWTD